ncbi:hypothetical protein HAHE_33150 [Haloferula helveola]|uniref:Lipoprotein n=1 Tax=Haloferula helveola TaxID=490095 RepID=A0ABN6H6T4_9BACT|nr:hypothetical protein HAHE_33150 [Haloferula helveola]
MKSPLLFGLLAAFAALLLSNCGSRGGLAAEEEAVAPEAHEMKQFRRSEYEQRGESLGWR